MKKKVLIIMLISITEFFVNKNFVYSTNLNDLRDKISTNLIDLPDKIMLKILNDNILDYRDFCRLSLVSKDCKVIKKNLLESVIEKRKLKNDLLENQMQMSYTYYIQNQHRYSSSALNILFDTTKELDNFLSSYGANSFKKIKIKIKVNSHNNPNVWAKLSNLTTVQYLDISDNQIGDAEAAIIANGKLTKLTE